MMLIEFALVIKSLEGIQNAIDFYKDLFESEKVQIAQWIKENIPELKNSPFTRESNFEKTLIILSKQKEQNENAGLSTKGRIQRLQRGSVSRTKPVQRKPRAGMD